jgi:predicted DNA-binding transcriptional regulator AlpA
MKFLRFRDLQEAGIVASWPMLARRIERDGFPPGRKLGPNSRAWTEQEVRAWLDSRPTARKAAPPRGQSRNATATA